MLDLLAALITIAVFGLAALYIHGADCLKGTRP